MRNQPRNKAQPAAHSGPIGKGCNAVAGLIDHSRRAPPVCLVGGIARLEKGGTLTGERALAQGIRETLRIDELMLRDTSVKTLTRTRQRS